MNSVLMGDAWTQWRFYGGGGGMGIMPQNLGLPPGCPHFSYTLGPGVYILRAIYGGSCFTSRLN